MDKYTLPAAGLVFLGIAALFGVSFFVPVLKTILMALFWFCGKVGILLFLFIWVRGTLPRFRYDQLMRFAWIVHVPACDGQSAGHRTGGGAHFEIKL